MFDIFVNGQLHTRLKAESLRDANLRAKRMLMRHKNSYRNLIQVAKKDVLLEGKDYASIRGGGEAEMILH